MRRIVTVTANAALDRTLWLERALSPGSCQIVREESCQAGGKGVNVSRVLARMAVPVHTIVVLGGATGDAIAADLHASRLEPRVVRAPGESRTCIEILTNDSPEITQLHGQGVRCTPDVEDKLLATVTEEIEGAAWLALCGSLPQGLSPGFYASAIERARQLGVRTALDASEAPLRAGLSARPGLVRVTIAEASAALGTSAAQAVESLASACGWWVLSDGANEVSSGTDCGELWRAVPPHVRVRNPIGCGDAMLAGLLVESTRKASPIESLRFGIALAAADAEGTCAGRTDLQRAAELSRQVEIHASHRATPVV